MAENIFAEDGSDADSFEGFFEEDIRQVNRPNFDNLDVSDISELDSISSDSSDDSEEESDVDDEEMGFRDELRNVNVPNFEQTTGFILPPYVANQMSPLDFFYKMYPERYFDIIAVETNRYARQSNAVGWFDTDGVEIRAYYAILIMMGIHKLPRYLTCSKCCCFVIY